MGARFQAAGWGEALNAVSKAIAAAAPERVAVLGGARLTNESQYVWAKLAKGVIGTDNFDAQFGDGLDPRFVLGLPAATIDDACRPGGIVVLIGPDPKEELGTLYLRLRHAITQDNVTLIEITPRATGLSQLAKHSLRPRPGTTAHLTWRLARRAAGQRDAAENNGDSGFTQTTGVNAADFAAAVEALKSASSPVTVILGQASLAEPAHETAEAAVAFAGFEHPESSPLATTKFLFALRRGNLRGAMEMGLSPGLLPARVPLAASRHPLDCLLPEKVSQSDSDDADGAGDAEHSDDAVDTKDSAHASAAGEASNAGAAGDAGDDDHAGDAANAGAAGEAGDAGDDDHAGEADEAEVELSVVESLAGLWPRMPESMGLDALGILETAANGDIDVLVLLGADPMNDFVDRDLALRGLRGAGVVIAVDLFANDSAALCADIVLPAAAPTECDGTFTNLEGRVSVMSHKVTPPGTARPDWMIAVELAERLEPGSTQGLDSPQAIRAEIAGLSPVHRDITEESLAANPQEGVLLSSLEPPEATRKRLHAEYFLKILSCNDHFTPAVPTPPKSLLAQVGATARDDSAREGGRKQSPLLLLVTSRQMYDDGVMLRHCESMRTLAAAPTARINPADLARIARVETSPGSASGNGIAPGSAVRVKSGSGHIDAMLETDDGVLEGSLAVNWLAPGAPANSLITAGEPVTFVKVEPR